MVINNMFSQKYKEELVEDMFDSMDQLDRIEFQNTLIQQNQHTNTLKIQLSTFLIVNFIAACFTIYFSNAFMHLLSLGLYSEIHRQSALLFGFMFVLSGFIFVLVFVQKMLLSDRTKKENDERLDFILDKE